ncbi:hypothetical protein BGP_0090 [Beggiatoa sp. PS]|nr:hypothetical protein BGP_0090 [Beggiatoa sp. PS]
MNLPHNHPHLSHTQMESCQKAVNILLPHDTAKGAVTGSIIGVALGGPIGAVIGYFAGVSLGGLCDYAEKKRSIQRQLNTKPG